MVAAAHEKGSSNQPGSQYRLSHIYLFAYVQLKKQLAYGAESEICRNFTVCF